MRTAAKWTATLLFLFLLPIWLFLLIPKLNGFSPETLKDQFRQHETFDQLSQVLQQSSESTGEQQSEVTDQALVVFRSALTPEYVEKKSNELIDKSSDWLTGRTEEQPQISFNDIKDDVIASYPGAQLQIDELTQQLQQAKEQLKDQQISSDGVPGLEGDGSTSSVEIAELLKQAESLDSFASGDFRLKLGNILEPVKQGFEIYQIALPALGVFLLLLLSAIVALGLNWHSRVKWTGWVLVIGAVGNALLAIVFSVAVLKIGIDMVAGMIPAQAEVGGTILRAIFASLFADYIRLEFVMSGVLLVIGITLLITALILKKRQAGSSSQPTLTDPKAKNQTEIEVETEKLVDIPNTSKKTSKESKDTT